MKESTRVTLLNTKVIDIEEKTALITLYLENENDATYAVEIECKKISTRLLD